MLVLLVEDPQDPCQTSLLNDENLDAGVDGVTVGDELALHRFDFCLPGSVAVCPLCAESFQLVGHPGSGVTHRGDRVLGWKDGLDDTQQGVHVGVYVGVRVEVRVWK
jgi:hypothetical protein